MKKQILFVLLLVLTFLPVKNGLAAPLAAIANHATYDDKDLTVWTYTGAWLNYNSVPSYNHSVHLSRALNSEATLSFSGDRFELIYWRGPLLGALDIYVDNVLETSLGQSNPTNLYQQRWVSPTYADGIHAVRLVHASGRYVSVDGIQVFGPPDLIPPASISDLAAAPGSKGGSATLTWSAPGDDGAAGTAASYQVRYATTAIVDETSWGAAFPVTSGIPAPLVAGSPQTMTINGLGPGVTYFFAVRALDEEPNLGGLSNSPSAAAQSSTLLPMGKYDDRNTSLVLNGGWVGQSAAYAYLKTLRYSAVIGNSVVFMFQGTDIELSYLASSQQGVMNVYLDGAFVDSINQYSPLNRWQRKWNSPVLPYGLHSVQLIHASGKRVNLDAVQVNVTVPWPAINLTPVVSGLSQPVLVTHAGDGSGRLFIVERGGRIRIFKNGALNGTPFLDIASKISTDGERGLFSLAFPPNYATANHFYIFYTDPIGTLTLSRFSLMANPDVADPNSEQIVLAIPHPGYSNHNGGHLAFGPDGYLYLSTGDGGGAGDPNHNGQNINVLLGKMLRLDVETGNPTTYTIPASNPFVGVAGADEIWAYGLRNVWRYSFDQLTGDLYIADVGQNAWEEVDFQSAGFAGGANYGWNVLEGNHCYSPSVNCIPPVNYAPPVIEYAHGANDSNGCAITGGYVYRGSLFPGLQGIYFYGDYCTGRIWAMQNVSGIWVTSQLLDTNSAIVSFGEDEAGNVYLVDMGGGVYRLGIP